MSRTYNSLSQLSQSVAGAGQTTTFAYDANGNQTNLTVDPSGLNQVMTQAFDALNRVTTMTDAANGVTTTTYDARNNLTSVTDPKGTTYTYDGLNRLATQQSPDTGLTTYAYDAAGNRTSQTDARGVVVNLSYDATNRLVVMDYPGTAEDVSYTYTKRGRRGLFLTSCNSARSALAGITHLPLQRLFYLFPEPVIPQGSKRGRRN